MKYRVIVTPEAEANIRESFLYIHERSPLNGERWLRGLYRHLETLENHPDRCAFARERPYLNVDLRQLVFKSHRIVFEVEKQRRLVYVLSVRHGKRLAAR